jgi:hypothetical protein
MFTLWGLLHALHQTVAILAWGIAQAPGSCAPRNLGFWTKRASQHPEGVELL